MTYKLVWSNGTDLEGASHIRGLHEAKRLAREVSKIMRIGVYHAHDSLASRGAGWVDPIAQFENGKPYPAHWVAFVSGANHEDLTTLRAAGIDYRHTIDDDNGWPFLIEAESADEAREKFEAALPDWPGRISMVGPRPATDKEVIDADMGM